MAFDDAEFAATLFVLYLPYFESGTAPPANFPVADLLHARNVSDHAFRPPAGWPEPVRRLLRAWIAGRISVTG